MQRCSYLNSGEMQQRTEWEVGLSRVSWGQFSGMGIGQILSPEPEESHWIGGFSNSGIGRNSSPSIVLLLFTLQFRPTESLGKDSG